MRPDLRILRLLLIALIIHNWLLVVSILGIVSLMVNRWLRDLKLRLAYRWKISIARIVILLWCLGRRSSNGMLRGNMWIIWNLLIAATSTTIGNISNTFLILTIGSLLLKSLNLPLQLHYVISEIGIFLLCFPLFSKSNKPE
jgi:hypothetical protein